LPSDFAGRLRPDGTFKIFSADRQLSCFVFVHGTGTPLPANWMSAEFTIDGEKLVATGQLKHAQSDLVYGSFEGDRLLSYKFEKTNRRGAGLHGSAAALKAEADRVTAFLKPFLSSFHRGAPVSLPTASDARAAAKSASATASAPVTDAYTFAGANRNAEPAAKRALVLLASPEVRIRLDDCLPLSLFRSRRSLCPRRRILRDICATKQRWKLGWDGRVVLEPSSW
jgi:hypothetical protein